MNQLAIDFDPDITVAFKTCVEYVHYRAYQQGVLQKVIAADMDLSPSHLSRKLAQNENDSMRLTVDDLEKYIQVTGDKEPIKYLAAKYLYTSSDEELKRQIEHLQRQLSVRADGK